MPPKQINLGICRFPGCSNKTLRVKGNDRNSNAYHKYCTTHRNRIANGLDPSKTPLIRSPVIDRITLRSIKKDNGCIEYPFSLDGSGYGHVCENGIQKRASRFIWSYYNGDVPNNLLVCHKCDNPLCVNIDHLFLGTHKDNYNDMISKNRDNRFSKLKENDVIDIYKSDLSTKDLSIKFNVSKSTINSIKHKVYWKKILNNL